MRAGLEACVAGGGWCPRGYYTGPLRLGGWSPGLCAVVSGGVVLVRCVCVCEWGLPPPVFLISLGETQPCHRDLGPFGIA
jgi:hypothetical protein